MTRPISRRQFIALSGLSGTAVAVSGCTINLQAPTRLEPYVIPPEEALPGQQVYYASTCGQCPAGCGILVRTSNGRAIKIEGHPQHPLNRGKTCARGQAGLQVLYNPDRLQNAVRQAQRGTKKFDPLPWEQALTLVADRVKAAKAGGVAFYGNLIPDALAAMVGPFLKALGGQGPVLYDPLVALDGRKTLERVTGQLLGGAPNLPMFDIAQADVLFSFAANFNETWLSPVAYGRAYGGMRGRPLGTRGYFVQFEPRMSSTAAVADKWIPVAPGTEGLVAMALGAMIVELGLGQAKDSPAAALFQAVDYKGIAAAAGVTLEKLEELARIFAQFPRPLAVPGGGLAGSTNAVQAMTAVMALNALMGQAAGPASGITLTPPPPDAAFVSATSSTFAEVKALIDRMNSGAVEVLFVAGNPIYELPVATRFAEALARVPFVVSFSPVADETAVYADLVLPNNTYLESWGYQVVTPPGDRPAVGSQQPVVTPLYDTRQTTDVFLDLAQRVNEATKKALPWPNTVAFMKDLAAKLVGKDAAYSTKTADQASAGFRQYGGWWPQAEAKTHASGVTLPASLSVSRPKLEGDPGQYPFALYPYPSTLLGDGRGANQPWLQEGPDPITTASWGTWVELNPETAKELGVQRDDIVKVISPQGQIEVIVYLHPGIRPDVVSIPLGQGHSNFGRYANSRGANALGILAPTVTEGGDLAWAATRVRIEKTGRQQTLPRIENNVGVDFANQAEKFPG
jgi:anaerobic selenocysteine-containing dehydrogenase